MGNQIGVELHPPTLENFIKIIKEEKEVCNGDTQVIATGKPYYKSVIKLWKFSPHPNDDLFVASQPIRFDEIEKFEETNCYIVVHLFLLKESKISKNKNKYETKNLPENMVKEVVESIQEVITPRGQTSAFGGYHSPTNLQSKQKTNGNFKYDIYIWQGKQVNSLIKANSVATVFDLDSLLKANIDTLLPLFYDNKTVAPLHKIIKQELINNYFLSSSPSISENHLINYVNKLINHTTKKSSKSSKRVRDKVMPSNSDIVPGSIDDTNRVKKSKSNGISSHSSKAKITKRKSTGIFLFYFLIPVNLNFPTKKKPQIFFFVILRILSNKLKL